MFAQYGYSSSGGSDTAAVFVVVIVWLVLGGIPAAIAHSKGHNAVGYYIFGLFLFLPALIVALLLQPRPRVDRAFGVPMGIGAASPSFAPTQTQWVAATPALSPHAPSSAGSLVAPDDMPDRLSCPQGHENPADHVYCSRCGQVLVDDYSRGSASSISPTAPASASQEPHKIDYYSQDGEFYCQTCGFSTPHSLIAASHRRDGSTFIDNHTDHNIRSLPSRGLYLCTKQGCNFAAGTPAAAIEHIALANAAVRPASGTSEEQRAALQSPERSFTASVDMRAASGTTREWKTCPDCAEEVRAAARKCRFCGFRFIEVSHHTQHSGRGDAG